MIPLRFSVGKLRSAWDIPGPWRDLGFVGEFVARYELARTQCYSRSIAFSLVFERKFPFLQRSRMLRNNESDRWASPRHRDVGRALECVTAKRKGRRKAEEKARKETRKEGIGSAITFRHDHRSSIRMNHRTQKIKVNLLQLKNRACIHRWCRYEPASAPSLLWSV